PRVLELVGPEQAPDHLGPVSDRHPRIASFTNRTGAPRSSPRTPAPPTPCSSPTRAATAAAAVRIRIRRGCGGAFPRAMPRTPAPATPAGGTAGCSRRAAPPTPLRTTRPVRRRARGPHARLDRGAAHAVEPVAPGDPVAVDPLLAAAVREPDGGPVRPDPLQPDVLHLEPGLASAVQPGRDEVLHELLLAVDEDA